LVASLITASVISVRSKRTINKRIYRPAGGLKIIDGNRNKEEIFEEIKKSI